jgi:ATP-dependent DNA ligase
MTTTPTSIPLPGTQQARPTESVEYFEENAEHFVMEPKFDGFRMLAELRGGQLQGWSRAHKPVGKTSMYQMLPHVHSMLGLALAGRGVTGYTVLDGEIYVDAKDGYHARHHAHVASVIKSLPERARSLQGVSLPVHDEIVFDGLGVPLTYFVFDVLFLDGVDQREYSWATRRSLLEWLIPAEWANEDMPNPVLLSPVEPPSQDALDHMLARGVEGCIVKSKLAPYQSWDRPRNNWWKYKVDKTADVVCMGFTDGREGKGVRNMPDTIGAIQFGQYQETDEGLALVYRGRTSGMDDSVRWGILSREKGIDRRSEFLNKVFEIRHNGIQNPGFRHPRFLYWRDDKRPEECLWD